MTTSTLLTKPEDTTIGCDPEVFFMRWGEVFPAVGLIGGSKHKPVPVSGGALQEDNIMAEFNTEPVTSVTEFIAKVNEVYQQLSDVANINGCDLGIYASKNIDPRIVDHFSEAKVFGCDPDYNAYTMKRNPTPDPESLLRTCAGHIHIGYDVNGDRSMEVSSYLVKYMDAFVGTWCVLNDEDTRRMTRYGKAGAFRHKPYGTEYRVPSNFWLKDTSLMGGIFERTREAYTAAYNNVVLPDEALIVEAINTTNKSKCEEVLSCLHAS